MNCKPGDLARVVAPGYFARCSCGTRTLVVRPDTLVTCSTSHLDGWYLETPIPVVGAWACGAGTFSGTCNSLPDDLLRPIRHPGDDAVDEMVAKLGAAPRTLTEVWEVQRV